MNSCTRRHVLVTGASSGIGRATALHLAAGGHHVYAGVRKHADGPVPNHGTAGEITPVLLDVTEDAQIAAAANAIAAHVAGAGLAGLVNNAGIGIFGPLEILPVAQFRRLMEVNVTAQLAVTQAFLPMLRQARGRIVMIGSIGTRFTPPFVGPLAASKSALATMGTALRQELAPWDIHVVLIEPASIRTEAVDKLHSDAAHLMSQAQPAQRALYQEAFYRLVDTFGARHQRGSPPEVVARAVARALTTSQPRARFVVGKNSRQMAVLAAALPTPVLDRIRRKLSSQPAPGSRVSGPGSSAQGAGTPDHATPPGTENP
jgi:NAD(P)-dependent dehydrogenase (short-subunit alcohol dehydrogenase family)